MADERAQERQEVRDFVTWLFERWRDAHKPTRGDGVAAFARAAAVPDQSLRIWLGRGGPAKRSGPSALYLIRMLRASDALTSEPPCSPERAVEQAEPWQVMERLADDVAALRRALEEQLPGSADAPRRESAQRSRARRTRR